MKKKIIFIAFIGALSLLLTTGCFNESQLKGPNITTTVYPIEYLIQRLYTNSNEVKSIYPNDTNINEYKLTKKQLNDYAKNTNLFIYNGLSNEKEIAKTLINKNKKMQIIDVSYGLKYKYGIEELWLNPNNYLMLANTIRNDLEEIISSEVAITDMNTNYKKLEEELTTLDAELRNLAKSAKNNNSETIVVAYDTFGFLETYGFEIVNITSENNITNSIKNKFKNKTYKYILVNDKENVTDSVKDIVDNYGAELIEINTMATLTDEERTNKDNYLTIMNEIITQISNIVLN